MKKSLLIFLLAIFFVACNNSNSPEVITIKFLESINSGNFKEAKNYCDESTAKLLEILANMPEGVKENKVSKIKVNIIKTDIKDDTAEVTYTLDDKKEEMKMNLKKIDGKWKVSIGKESGKESGHGHEHDHDHSEEGHYHFNDSISGQEELPDEIEETNIPLNVPEK